MKWNDVEYGFQIAFCAAWEAYMGGSIPIGAAILNQNGEVVAIGRNRIYESDAPRPQIFHHRLAHAEINAILQLSEEEYPDIREYQLFSVMEPCPLCLGAIAMGSIKHVKYVARDGWAGATSLIEENKYLHNKRIHIEGPFPELEKVHLAWQGYFELEKYNKDFLLNHWEQDCPDGIKAARLLYQTKVLHQLIERKASVAEAFELTSTILETL